MSEAYDFFSMWADALIVGGMTVVVYAQTTPEYVYRSHTACLVEDRADTGPGR